MKNNIKYLIGAMAVTGMLTVGCKDAFFNRPPENEPTVGTYYKTTAQVQSSTNILYSAPWFGFNGKALEAITALESGNARCWAGTDGEFDALNSYTQGNGTLVVQSTWNSLYTVVAQCNALLNNLPSAVSSSVPTAVVNNALGEGHLMRAVAYFYLVRLFGNVPIITNPTPLISTFDSVRTNPVADVYKFIVSDLQFAEANCAAGGATSGHGSSASASALLAKVYLYMQDYADAKTEAEKVINSGDFGLMGLDFSGSFVNLFEEPFNNNAETILALQWTANSGYGFGNQIQSVVALNSTITGTGDGYAELGPTWDLQDAFKAAGDTVRRHGTIMLPGEYYPELNKANGGYTVPLNADAQGTHAAIKKYVTGTPSDNNGNSAAQAAGNNTYIMRYAGVYLIAAEAIMGMEANPGAGHGIDTSFVCSDPTALGYLNRVRERAGLPAVTSFSYRDLIKERRLEFAFEGEYWFDLQRIDGFNSPTHPVARAIISRENKGDSDSQGTAANNYTDYNRNYQYFTPTDAQFLLPIPATDVSADPALLEPPVPYKF